MVAQRKTEIHYVNATRLYAETNFEEIETVQLSNGLCSLFTHRGPNKNTNEDAVAIVPVGEESTVLIVADGLGGHPQGEQAAKVAIETVINSIGHHHGLLREAILNGIEQANIEIRQSMYGSATTLAILEIEQEHVRAYHVGDPFVVVTGQRGKIKFQSIAHSPVGYAVEAGMLDENDAVHHEERNIVSNVVGDSDMHIDIGPLIKLAPRDTVLISSDGLSDNLYVEEIVENIRVGPLGRAANQLKSLATKRMSTAAATRPSHPDDLSFIIFRLDINSPPMQSSISF